MTKRTIPLLVVENSSDGEIQEQEQEEKDGNDRKSQFNWLEEWALEGAEKVGLMGIDERTQRVMLAQMAEDQIYENSKILETLVDKTTGEIEPEKKERLVTRSSTDMLNEEAWEGTVH